MNLINDPWIPVRLADGTRTTLRPAEIVSQENPPVGMDAPRADFNGALAQFLIGLLQTSFAPHDDDQWLDLLEDPPGIDTLDNAFRIHAEAFSLDGEGPRFMQDLEPFEHAGASARKPAENGIANLLIDTPGDQTLRNNADHFIKRDRVEALCPACAATALFTLQLNAPSGGAGHRVSLRGGGPLTTLVALDPEGSELPDTLWHNLWLNVLPGTVRLTGNPALDTPEHIFPWLAPTRTSDPKAGGQDTTPEDTHPLQMYWAMPRRIRLDLENTKVGACDLCDTQGQPLIQRYFTLNYGTNYTGAWRHPLSPYQERDSAEPLPLHPQPGGIGYRHWLGLVYARQDNKQRVVPAQVVGAFLHESEGMGQARIRAFGYDMDNMKPRCWYEAIMPLYRVPEAIRERFSIRIDQMIQAAELVAGMLRTTVKKAWFKQPGDARGDTSFLADGFYQHTEADFYSCLPRLIEQIPRDQDRAVLSEWHQILQRAALALFDEWAASGDLAFGDPARVARARDELGKQLKGKKLKQILSLPTTKEKTA